MSKLDDIAYYFFTLLVGGVFYLIRRVFTNQREIELLKRDLDLRDIQRTEANERISASLTVLETNLQEVKEEVRYLRRNSK